MGCWLSAVGTSSDWIRIDAHAAIDPSHAETYAAWFAHLRDRTARARDIATALELAQEL